MNPILVVDDYADTREMLATIFEDAGYEVVLAADGVDAVAQAQAHHPAVVIMDLFMPKVDGIEATRRIKATKGLHDVRIVAHSARPGHVDTQLFDAICSKPCPPDVLLDIVKKIAAATH